MIRSWKHGTLGSFFLASANPGSSLNRPGAAMSDPRGGLRGRPRKALNPPQSAMVEFGHYLRQQRLTAGVENMKYAAELVGRAMRHDASGAPVTARYLGNVERGNSGQSDEFWRQE